MKKMLKSSSLLNLLVYSAFNERKIGYIKDLIYLNNSDKLDKIVIGYKDIFTHLKVISVKYVTKITKDAVYVDEDFLADIKEKIESNSLIGAKVTDSNGEEIGKVSDILIDSKNISDVRGFVLSNGIINDIMHGRNAVEKNDDMIINDNNIIINDKFDSEE